MGAAAASAASTASGGWLRRDGMGSGTGVDTIGVDGTSVAGAAPPAALALASNEGIFLRQNGQIGSSRTCRVRGKPLRLGGNGRAKSTLSMTTKGA